MLTTVQTVKDGQLHCIRHIKSRFISDGSQGSLQGRWFIQKRDILTLAAMQIFHDKFKQYSTLWHISRGTSGHILHLLCFFKNDPRSDTTNNTQVATFNRSSTVQEILSGFELREIVYDNYINLLFETDRHTQTKIHKMESISGDLPFAKTELKIGRSTLRHRLSNIVKFLATHLDASCGSHSTATALKSKSSEASYNK